jgi:hypothetical protein
VRFSVTFSSVPLLLGPSFSFPDNPAIGSSTWGRDGFGTTFGGAGAQSAAMNDSQASVPELKRLRRQKASGLSPNVTSLIPELVSRRTYVRTGMVAGE